MIWHILGSISKLTAEVLYRLSFGKCLLAPTPLSDYRGDCPVSQVNQESTIRQLHSCHSHRLSHAGHFSSLHHIRRPRVPPACPRWDTVDFQKAGEGSEASPGGTAGLWPGQSFIQNILSNGIEYCHIHYLWFLSMWCLKLRQAAVLQPGQTFLSAVDRRANLVTCSQEHPCYQCLVVAFWASTLP